MCDANSFITAGTQMMQSNIQAKMRRDQGDFEAKQFQNLGILAGAKGKIEMANNERQFTEHLQTNMAAAAVSGAGIASFESVFRGNMEEKEEKAGQIKRNADSERAAFNTSASIARVSADLEAKALQLAGIVGAAGTMNKMLMDFKETAAPDKNVATAGFNHFKKSLGFGG
jgi:hypothetical protein